MMTKFKCVILIIGVLVLGACSTKTSGKYDYIFESKEDWKPINQDFNQTMKELNK